MLKKLFKKIKNKNYINSSFSRNAKILSFNKHKNINNKNILIASSAGGLYSQMIFESTVASGLRDKGANVEFLLCNKSLPSCIMPSVDDINEDDYLLNGAKKICNSCFDVASNYLRKANFKINLLTQVKDKDIDYYNNYLKENFILNEVNKLKYRNINIGEHAVSGTLRYYRKTNFTKERLYNDILKNYLVSAMITVDSFYNLLKSKKFDKILLNHGIYVPQGVIAEIAKKENIQFIVWCPGARKKTYSFSPNDTYHREIIYEDNKTWENIDLNEKKVKIINEYLKSRSNSKDDGKNDWVYAPTSTNDNVDLLFDRLKIDPNKPLIGLATNVMWDAQIDYPTNFFKNILDWIFFTVDHFIKNQNLQLIIRVHPAEIDHTKPSKQKVVDELYKKYGSLPSNIFLVKPDENFNTYKILDKCENILIYGSRLGIEMSALGKMVVVCGEGFIRNKKIAIDVNSKVHYQKILENLPLENLMVNNRLIRAKKYAYHFFIRRMIPIKVIDEVPLKWPNIAVNKNFQELLKLKKDQGFEKICKSIINDEKFVFDDY